LFRYVAALLILYLLTFIDLNLFTF
jgi:hypothetical protein